MLEDMDARLFYEYSSPTTPPRAIISQKYLGQNLEDIPLHIIPSQDSKLPTYTIHEDIVAPSLSQEATSLLQPTPLTTLQTTLLMVALCTAVFLAALDTVILTTALPTITASLHTSTSGAAWIGSSFMLANASSVPFWGSASDIFGRKPLLLLANSIFMTGSIISALAGNLAILLAGRSIQGIGAGGITVLVNIIVSDIFVMRTRSLMLTLVGSVWFFAATIGPVIGGTFAEKAGWRWCFWVNTPFNITSFILLTHLLRLHTPHTSLLKGLALLDWPGFLTLPTGTTLLLLGLEFGGTSSSWSSPLVLSLLFSGALTLAIFLIIESRIASNPLIPLHLFSSLSTISTLLVCAAHAMCYISVAYFLPYYFQAILSFSPLFSGLWSLITAFTLLFTTLSCGWYMHSTGRYLELIRFGLAFLVVGFGLFTIFSSSLSVPRMVIFQIVMSLGLGPLFQAPLVALQAHLEKKDIATGTATFGFVRMLSAGISVVVGELIFQSQMRKRAHLFISSGILPAIAEKISSGSSAVGTVLLGELTQAQRYIVRGAQSQSLNSMWMFCIAVAAVGLIAGFGVRGRKMSKVDEETMGLKIEESRDVSGSGSESCGFEIMA